MQPPPAPIIPSGLSPNCPDVLGQELFIDCQYGWGWQLRKNGVTDWYVEDEALFSSELIVMPESYIEFTTPKSGLFGKVITNVPGHELKHFLAYTMSDGVDFDFADKIASAWRVMLGDGVPDYDSWWFPVLDGNHVYFGYGTVAQSKAHLDAFELRGEQMNYQPPDLERG